MLLKHIDCRVYPDQVAAFWQGQLAWSALADVAGFVAQFGGWRGACAEIVGLWRDEAAYEAFMRLDHDAIADRGRQGRTMASLEVELFDLVDDTPGQVAEWCERVTLATHMSLVVTDRRPIGEAGELDGSLGGGFWRSRRPGSRWAALSLWRTPPLSSVGLPLNLEWSIVRAG